MSILNPGSLAETIDVINDVIFAGIKIPQSEKIELAKWLSSRQGIKGSYAGMPAPTEMDFKNPVKVFTGEKITTAASKAHILGEEACRAMILIGVRNKEVKTALENATAGILNRINESEIACGKSGMYCCGICTVSYWRHMTAGGLADTERRTEAGLKALKEHRLGDGRWRRFPYYYTLLALEEIDHKLAIAEMKYAAPGLEHLLNRKPSKDKHINRRQVLAVKILSKC